jgi:hypothetical protein
MAARYVRIGQHPDYRDELRVTLSEILSSPNVNPGTFAVPEDVTGCFLEMGLDGKWAGPSVGNLTQAQADTIPVDMLTIGTQAVIDGVVKVWNG